MNATDNFSRYARPELARVLRALNLDVSYQAAQGDYLIRDSPVGADQGATEDRVLDLVGGFGASLFGHNHPALIEVVRRCLDGQVPFNAQASIRPGAAHLAERLSATVGAVTGASYVVTLGSTGAEAVEAAVKHAAVERSRRLGAMQEDFEQSLRQLGRLGVASIPCASGPAIGRPCAEVLSEAIDAISRMRRSDPIFVSLRGAFHGKTTGANMLTDGPNVPTDLHVPGPRRWRLDDWTPSEVVTALDSERMAICAVSFDAAGVPHSAVRYLSPVAACFAEPVQGEGGVREVPAQTLAALRELADRHAAALVFDEIQCGMGRTGTFLASETSGVIADYYLLSKSLGGGLTKISALLVAANHYVADFGRYHTSTFAEDDLSALIGVAALDLSLSYRDRINVIGAQLRDRLAAVAARRPDAIAEVRGRGLLLAVEFRVPQLDSGLLREVFAPEALGYLIAGRLLHTHRIRAIPTLSAPTAIRVQPSALLEPADVDRIATAFDEVAGLLAHGDYATLLDHLTVPGASAWQPRQHVPQPRRDRSPQHSPSRADLPRVAFLANLDVPSTVRSLAPALAGWSDEQCAAALGRVEGELRPFEVARRRITSAAQGSVECILVAVPFTAARAVAALGAGDGAWLRRTVLDAVDLGVSLGAEVIGLGGYTSIVTDAARDVIEDEVRITSGNSLTAACAYDLLRLQLVQSSAGERRVGLVGAIGNIGAVMAELIVRHCDSLLLVGRPGSARRLAKVANRLAHLADVSIAEDLRALRDCPIVFTATNSADPVILPDHLCDDRDVLVCDLAVPGDVHPAVAGLPNVTTVSGGRIQLPSGQAPHLPGFGLPPGIVYSCMAETILLGFEPGLPTPSYGGLNAAGVLAARDLAARHGLDPARMVSNDILAQPWIADQFSSTIEEHIG